MRNLMSFKSNDYQTWCNFLVKNEILETCVESLEEDSEEIEPAVKEVTLPLHIHSEDIEIAISSINDKIDLLRSKGKMKIIVDEISKHEKDIEVLNDITNFGQKCKTHDGCVVMNYTYCSKEGGCGRLTNARSPQGLPKRVRRLLIPKIYSYDIETSVFSILRYLSIKIDQTIIERIPSINAYIENKKEIREELAKRVFMFDKKNVIPFDAKVKMIKSAMTSIGFGGKLQCTIKRDGSSYQAIGDSFNIEKYYNNRSACTNFIEDEYVKKFYGEFNLIKDLIVSHYRDKTDILGGFPFIKDKDSELLSHVYQSFESKILRSVLKTIDDSNGTNGFPFKSQRSILPLHDGICTSWLLDKYVFEKAFRDVLSNDYPDYLPKVELTYLNTEENKSLTDSEIESIKRNHLKDVQKEERLAQQYINNFAN